MIKVDSLSSFYDIYMFPGRQQWVHNKKLIFLYTHNIYVYMWANQHNGKKRGDGGGIGGKRGRGVESRRSGTGHRRGGGG